MTDSPIKMLMSHQQATDVLTGPGAEFEICDEEIRGVATRTWGGCAGSLVEALELSREFGERDFLVYYDRDGKERRLTFEQHYRAVCKFAHALVHDLGIAKGDRVALAARNLPEWSVVFFAAAAAGAIMVPLNAWWTGAEMAYGLRDSGTRLLVGDAQRLERLLACSEQLGELAMVLLDDPAQRSSRVELGEEAKCQTGPSDKQDADGSMVGSADSMRRKSWRRYTDFVAPAIPVPPLVQVDIEPDDDATIFYTSGTTGSPKGALGTHRNICSNLRATEFLKRRGEVRTGIVADPAAQPATLLSVPMFHVTGCHSTLLPALASGTKLVLTYRFDAEQTVRLIEKEEISSFGGVPTLVWRVLESPNFHDHDHSTVLRIAYGGAPAAPELVRRLSEEFPGATSSNGYGLTESSALAVANAGPEYLAKPTSVGLPIPVCEAKVCDQDGNEIAIGQVGELWLNGPNIIKGYWGKPEATAEVFVDGWLRTGDLARLDAEGFVFICDRVKDMVIRGGENVYSAEVEAALHEHPNVVSAAVYGVADRVLGEELAASLQVRSLAAMDEEALGTFVSERIAKFKVPTVWDVGLQALPLNANGKILKRELRAKMEQRRGE